VTESAIVLDAGPLIAAERGDGRAIALLMRSLARTVVLLPAGVLAQVWRGGPRQHRLHLLLGDERVEVVPLDRNQALLAGTLCAIAGTSDIVDASVVAIARSVRAAVVSSDRDDLQALDPSLRIVTW
jgi:hypothetical protein